MIKKILILIVFVVSQQSIISQIKDTCEKPIEDPLLELNSISKCSVEETVKKSETSTEKISIQVSTRRRVVRKRDAAKGISKLDVAHKIASIKEKASLVGNLDLSSEEVLENVPFNIVEEIPLFKDCERSPLTQQQKCFKEEINNHIRKNFIYPENAYDAGIQGRVYVQFIIDQTGSVENLRIRGPYKGELLEEEAKRIIGKLPKLKPGKHNGREVKVKYGFPINFKIPGKKPTNVRKKKEIKPIDNSSIVNFSSVEKIPTFKICGVLTDNSYECFNRELIRHINKNFTYPEEAMKNYIQGEIMVHFVVGKDGNVTNIKAIGPEGCEVLEVASKKILEKLPVLSPGLHQGKPVNVKHSFPLNYSLD